MNLTPLPVSFKALVHIDDVPAEVPDSSLRGGRGRNLHSCEKDIYISFFQCGEARKAGSDRAGELARVKGNRGVWINRIQVKVVESRSG